VSTLAEKIISSPLTMASHGNGELPNLLPAICTSSVLTALFLINRFPLFCSSQRTSIRDRARQVQLEMSRLLDKLTVDIFLRDRLRSIFTENKKHTILIINSYCGAHLGCYSFAEHVST
jgi:hypothetical protein